MPYATPQDLIDRLGTREATMISDRAGLGQPDLAVLADALAVAEDEVNSYVGRRYYLPLSDGSGPLATAPSVLQRLTIDIARYRQTGTEIMETETIRNRYKDAVRMLEQIAEGKISLGDLQLAGVGRPAAVGGVTAARTGAKMFGDQSGML